MIRRRKLKRRLARRDSAFRPHAERLEARALLAGDLRLTGVQFVDIDNNPIGTPVVGEQIFLRAEWTATDLASSDTYYLRVTDQTQGISPIVLNSSTFRRQAAGVETRMTVIGGWYAGPGQHRVEVSLDQGNTVAETNEANNKTVVNFTPLAPTTLPQKFLPPLAGQQNEDWSIINYVDLDPLPDDGIFPPETRDYFCDEKNVRPYPKCGAFTFDGSTGIDFQLPNFSAMDEGQAVYAVMPGTVTSPLSGFTFRGVGIGDSTGHRVSSLSDINGDNFADFLVTAPAGDADLAGDGVLTDNVGQTFVVYGRFGGFAGGFDLANLLPDNGGDGSQGFVLQGIQLDDNSGLSVTTGGDFNKDGLADLVIGAPNADRAGNRSGEVYVVFGRAAGFPATVNLRTLSFVGGGNGEQGFILVGERVGDRAGTSVSFAGDLNDDGFDDLIVGAPFADFQVGTTSYFDAGRSYVVYGTDLPFPAEYSLGSLLTPLTPGMVQRGFVIDGETSFDNVGQSVAGLGDFNGDGVDDVAIGAPFSGTNFSGDVYIVFGRDSAAQFVTPFASRFSLTTLRAAQLGDGSLGTVYHGDVNGDSTGNFVTALGDINGDGIRDLAIGAPNGGLDVRPSGLVYIVYGQSTPFSAESNLRTLLPLYGGDGTAGVVVQGGNTNDQVGNAIAPIGDFNGDGFLDMAVGAPGLDDAGTNAGGVYIIYGSATPLPAVVELISLGQAGATPGMLLLGLTGSQTGFSVAGLGDVDGDARTDLLIGSPLLSVAGDAVGGGYVVAGRQGGYRRIVSLGLLDATGDQPLEIDHGNGWITRYSHLNQETITVKVGDTVAAGDILGLVGDRSLGEASLHFEVLHRGSVVETYLDPASYWLRPLTYQGTTTQLPLVAGVTNVDPTSSLEEGPTSISRLHPTFTGTMYYWTRVSHLNPYDEWQVTWIRPDGTRLADAYSCQSPKGSPIFSSNPPFCQDIVPSPNHFPLITSSRSVNWRDYPGTWQVQFKVNGQVRNIETFTIASSPVEPKIRVTTGSVAPDYDLIVNGRQTPIDFGELLVNDASPTVQIHIENRGSTALHLTGITIPEGFVLRSTLPTQVNVDDAATLLLEMDTTVPGTPFGEVVITSDDPLEPVYQFLVEGQVTGSLPAGSPQVFLPSGPVGYLWGAAPVVVDPQAQFSDTDSSNLAGGTLRVSIVANGSADDQLAITTSGQVTQFGNQVVYGGLSIGSIAGGTGIDPLLVTFNSDATPEAVQALLRGITYANSAQAPGAQSRFVRFSITDDTGKTNQSAMKRVVLGPSNQNQFPTVGLLTANPSPVVQPATLSLTASGVFDVDGLVQKVSFYVESNSLLGLQTGNGGDLLVGVDSLGTDGWATSFNSALLSAGTRTAYAVAEDDQLASSEPASTTFRVIPPNAAPSIVFLSTTPSTVISPESTVVTANGVSDLDGFVARVDFYRETNGEAGLQIGGDLAIGFDTSSAGGWALNYSSAGLLDGVYTLYGVATDNLGTPSTSVSTTLQVGTPPPPGSVFYLSDLLPPTGNGTSGFVLNGKSTEDNAGYSVSSAGDINRDGFDDLLIGAPQADVSSPSRTDAGVSYIVFGRIDGFAPVINLDSLSGSAGFKIIGAQAGDFAGYVSSAGDVNGDGFGDLLIGATGVDAPGQDDAGAAYLVFGRASGFGDVLDLGSLNGINGFRMTGIASNDATGLSVSGAGDFNRDGFADILVAARQADDSSQGFVDSGSVYLLFGKASGFASSISLSALDGVNGFQMNGLANDFFAGISAQAAGDVNGDGFGDIILGGVVGLPGTVAARGAAFVVFGRAGVIPNPLQLDTLDGFNGFRINGQNIDDLLGFSVGSIGDFNRDGFDDLVVGAPGADPGAPAIYNSGSAYVIYGAGAGFASVFDLLSLNGSNGFRVDGTAADGFLGVTAGRAGDMNGDGFDDLLLGASGASPGTPPRAQAGEAYVIFGRADNASFGPIFSTGAINGVSGFRIEGVAAGDSLGLAVSAAGDVNGDGFDDLILGAPNATVSGAVEAGQAYLFFGRDFTKSITQLGGQTADTLLGSSGSNVMNGAQSNDSLIGLGGFDVLRGGQGDDSLAVGDLAFRKVVGGRGIDTLKLTGQGEVLDLTNDQVAAKLVGIEVIDLTGSGINSLIVDVASVLNASDDSNELLVRRDNGDTITFGTGWSLTDYRTIDGQVYYELSQNAARLVIQAVAEGTPWQNPANPLDTNNDGSVVPLDALVLINYLNVQGTSNQPLPNPPTPSFAPKPLGNEFYYDVNGDGFASPIDVLLVINFLNSPSGGEGSGEGEQAAAVPLGWGGFAWQPASNHELRWATTNAEAPMVEVEEQTSDDWFALLATSPDAAELLWE